MEQVSQEELAGVLAHELGHVKHRDTLTMTITAVMAGAISMLANMAFFMGGSRDRDHPMGMVGMLLVTMLAPIAAMLVQAAISRSREYEADRAGAEITGRPMWLASALGQIERAAERTPNYPADANPATAHMFIINPLHGGISGLFSTHPPTAERIARLRAMAGAGAAPCPWGQLGSRPASRSRWARAAAALGARKRTRAASLRAASLSPWAEYPPSTGIAVPVMKSDAGLAKKHSDPRHVFGRAPARRPACAPRLFHAVPKPAARAPLVRSVSIQPGSTALT